MYDELVKALRETDFGDTCVLCEHEDMCKGNDCIIIQAADAIEKLGNWWAQADKLIQMLEMPRWIPVEERRAEFPCICYDANGNIPFIPQGIVTIKDDQGLWQIDAHLADPVLHQNKIKPLLGYQNRITHWLPLPEPPKEET